MTGRRTSDLTDAATAAIRDIETLVDEVIAEIALPPLGSQIVPESTRRGREQRNTEAIATLFYELSTQFGPEQVQEVLTLPAQDGRSILEHMVQQYGEEVMQKAFGELARRLQHDLLRPDEAFLPEVNHV